MYRHPLAVRITHWITALALGVLAMSGMQIFNAHPALYSSDTSHFSRPALAIRAEQSADGAPIGYVQAGSLRINTTHVLGYGPDGMGGETARAFPSWATIPAYQSLADGRRWHIFFAWIFALCAAVYARFALQLVPTRADFRALPRAIVLHLKPWKLPRGEAQNPVQKVSYFAIVWVVAPVVILSGLALSPSVDAWVPWLPQFFGGRQFARLWHFASMITLMGFFAVHVTMVILTGFSNNMRSMITGWFATKGTQEQ